MNASDQKRAMVEAALDVDGHPLRPLDNVVLLDTFEKSRSGYYLHHADDDTSIPDDQFSETSRPEAEYDLDWGTVMRSNMSTHWWGSHGSQSGLYSLKVGTPPRDGATTCGIKRLTHPYFTGEEYETLRFETVFTYHEEPRGTSSSVKERSGDQSKLGHETFGSIRFEIDIQDRENRWWPGIRYVNYDGDSREEKWQYYDGSAGKDPMHEDFVDLPGGDMELCWNSPNDSVGWKPNWHYLRWDLDVSNKSYREFQCNDVVIDMSELELAPIQTYPHVETLLNPLFRVETNADTRSFLFLDSLAISAEV